MIISNHNFYRRFAAVALTQLLASICYSQPKDVAGWETARWGMFNQDLVAAFGTRLQKLPKRMTFLNCHADYVLSREIGGRAYTVFFQMANDTNKLSQVLVRLDEMESHTPREDIFNVLSSSLARDYGKPTANSNDRYRFGAGFKGMALSRTWRFPTTTVELAYGWDDQIFASTLTIRYFPTQATPNNLLQRSAGQRGSQDAS